MSILHTNIKSKSECCFKKNLNIKTVILKNSTGNRVSSSILEDNFLYFDTQSKDLFLFCIVLCYHDLAV